MDNTVFGEPPFAYSTISHNLSQPFQRISILSQARKVHFHVGAHKTATTYMQSRLRSNKRRLRKEGIDFIDLWAKTDEMDAYRTTLKVAIESDRIDEKQAKEASRLLRAVVDGAISASNSIVVMSYENVLGDFDLSKGRTPYPNIEIAVCHIAAALRDYDLRIYFSFRSLDRFVESGYLQRIYTRFETRRFKEYIDLVDANNVSWIPAVRSMASIVGRENVMAWAYEDFLVDESPVWNSLLSRSDAETVLVRPAKKVNKSLSEKGLKYMRGINRLATAADAKKFRRFIRRNFRSQPGQEPPRLLDDARRQVLIENYTRNCREIGSSCQFLIQSPRYL